MVRIFLFTSLLLATVPQVVTADPIQVCICNRSSSKTLYVALVFDRGGASRFTLPPKSCERRGGADEGDLCWSYDYFNLPSCPNKTPQNGFECNN